MTDDEKNDLRALTAETLRDLLDACKNKELLRCLKRAKYLMKEMDAAFGTTDKPGEYMFD